MNKASYLSGALQVKAYRVLQQHVAKQIGQYNMNPAQWFIIGQIKVNRNIRTAELADFLRVDPPLITKLTDDLTDKGLITKKANPEDKRVKQLYLTPKGSALIPIIEKDIHSVLHKLLHGTTEKELQTYGKVLETIVKNG